jgi:hypothetical protein
MEAKIPESRDMRFFHLSLLPPLAGRVREGGRFLDPMSSGEQGIREDI